MIKTDDELVEIILDYDYQLTDNIDEAIYLLRDGRMIDGVFDCGIRGEDHRMIECAIDSDRYENDFWDKVHETYGLVRLVPETKIALIQQGQELTSIQKEILSNTNYQLEEY